MRYSVETYRDERSMERAMNELVQWEPLLMTAVKERGFADTTEYTVVYRQKEQNEK